MKKLGLVLMSFTLMLVTSGKVIIASDTTSTINTDEQLEEVVSMFGSEKSTSRTFSSSEKTQEQIGNSLEAKAAKYAFSSKSLFSLKVRSAIINTVAIPTLSTSNFFRFTMEIEEVNGYDVYVYTPINNYDTSDVLLYAHGGGFSLQLIAGQVNAMLDIAYQTGQKVVIPIYPLSIESNGNATTVLNLMNSTFDMYEADGYSVDLIGDSAGGAIVLSTVAYRETNDMSLPNNVVALFPVLDGTYSNPEIASIESDDPFLAASGLRVSAKAYAGDLDVNDYRVSPINGEYSNNYNLMISSADTDILRPDIMKFTDDLNAKGITHNFKYYPNTYHDFILFSTKESEELKREVADFINSKWLKTIL